MIESTKTQKDKINAKPTLLARCHFPAGLRRISMRSCVVGLTGFAIALSVSQFSSSSTDSGSRPQYYESDPTEFDLFAPLRSETPEFLTTRSGEAVWYRDFVPNSYRQSIPLAVLGAVFVHGDFRGHIPSSLLDQLPQFQISDRDLNALDSAFLMKKPTESKQFNRDVYATLTDLGAVKHLRSHRSTFQFRSNVSMAIQKAGHAKSFEMNELLNTWSDLLDLIDLHEDLLRLSKSPQTETISSLLAVLIRYNTGLITILSDQYIWQWDRLNQRSKISSTIDQALLELRILRLWMSQSISTYLTPQRLTPQLSQDGVNVMASAEFLRAAVSLPFQNVATELTTSIKQLIQTRSDSIKKAQDIGCAGAFLFLGG